MSPSMYSLKKVTASAAEGKESSVESSCSPGHVNGLPGDFCAFGECATDSVGAAAGSHAARTTRTGSHTMSLRRTNGRTPLGCENPRVRHDYLLGQEALTWKSSCSPSSTSSR
jgi:hypothetical protein